MSCKKEKSDTVPDNTLNVSASNTSLTKTLSTYGNLFSLTTQHLKFFSTVLSIGSYNLTNKYLTNFIRLKLL